MSRERITLDVAGFLRQGKALAVDPALRTGYAVIDAGWELVCYYGVAPMADELAIQILRGVMCEAELLIIEDQYLARDGRGRKRQNPDTVIKLAATRGGIEMLWAAEKKLALGENVVRVKPSKWQGCLNLSARAGRDKRKAASVKQAKFLTGIDGLREDEADAICMGLAMLRKMKKIRLLQQRRLAVR